LVARQKKPVNTTSSNITARVSVGRKGTSSAGTWAGNHEVGSGRVCWRCAEKVAYSVFLKRHAKTDNKLYSVVPNLIEMLGTLLGRAGGGAGGGGGAGAVATTWMREILFALGVVRAVVFHFRLTI
jgi:hypothetical protein